jgi:polyhydroxyalkanoate synthesis regulator phasin
VLPAKGRIVMGTTVPADRRKSFWRTIARTLEDFGDALDITEATLLAERVSKLEKEVAKLKEQRPT